MQTPKIFKNALGKTQDCDLFANSSASSKVLCSALILTDFSKQNSKVGCVFFYGAPFGAKLISVLYLCTETW